jgi:hypothetical protein
MSRFKLDLRQKTVSVQTKNQISSDNLRRQQNLKKKIPIFYASVQVILFEIDCAIFYTNLHESFCQFISCTNWVNSGKFMDNC